MQEKHWRLDIFIDEDNGTPGRSRLGPSPNPNWPNRPAPPARTMRPCSSC